MKNENPTFEVMPTPAKPAVTIRVVHDFAPILRLILATLYRLAVAGGALALVWRGASPWLILAVLPLLVFTPRSR